MDDLHEQNSSVALSSSILTGLDAVKRIYVSSLKLRGKHNIRLTTGSLAFGNHGNATMAKQR